MKNSTGQMKFLAMIYLMLFISAYSLQTRGANLPSTNVSTILQMQVTGTVSDKNGIPIPGVTLRIKNSSSGTITNSDGAYTITVTPDATLIFSYLGFQEMEVPVDNQSEINVQLEEDVTALGEVEINAGYYHTTRRESTGNISRVTAQEIELQPVVSPIQALQGRMAGVEVVPGPGGYPGSASTIRIRGTNSLRPEGNYPLYIIDGVPVNSVPLETFSNLIGPGIDPLNTLNLSNIESIEVLKDADATAIYGSRGANGVVLITTKKAAEGDLQIEARVYKGVSDVPYRINLLGTEKYLEVRRKAFENDGIEPSNRNAYDLLLWDQDRETNWQDVFFGGTSPVTDVNISASGGNEFNSYRVTGSYHTQGTVYMGEYDYSKFTTSFHGRHTSKNKKLNLNLVFNYGLDDNSLPGNFNMMNSAFQLPPNAPALFNSDGSLSWEDYTSLGVLHPLQGYYNNSNTNGQHLNSNLIIDYEIINGLNFRTSLGYNAFNGDEIAKQPLRSFNPAQTFRRHNTTFSSSRSRSLIIEPQIHFNKDFGRSRIEALVGATFQEREATQIQVTGEGFVSESLMGDLSAAETVTVRSNETSEYRYSAVFARLGYNWDKKYYINLTGRRDGSSRFGPGKRIADFGAVGAAWIFSEERWIEDRFSFISFGKLRGSYGTTGNDQIGDYGFIDSYEATYGPGGIYPNQLANPNYSWEVNSKLEVGMELGLINDRINLGVSWFRNRSSNQLVGFSLPAITGFNSVQANLPATVENTGWEFELMTYNIQSDSFKWQTSLNFSIPKNRLIDYPDLEFSPYANTYSIGHPLNILFLYKYGGLDPETGFYTVIDANKDGRIDSNDRTEIWSGDRTFQGGISNNLTYKNVSLQFLWQYVKQEGRFSLFDAGFLRPQIKGVYDAVNSESIYQRISTSLDAVMGYNYALNSTFPIVDASFLRLKTISVGYSLPNYLLQDIGVKSGTIFLSGYNLLTITDYIGLDPELPHGGTSFGALRSVTAGVQFVF